MQGKKRKRKRTKEKTSFRLEERSVFKKSLTEPTLLEMSGNATYQEFESRGTPQLASGSSFRISNETNPGVPLLH